MPPRPSLKKSLRVIERAIAVIGEWPASFTGRVRNSERASNRNVEHGVEHAGPCDAPGGTLRTLTGPESLEKYLRDIARIPRTTPEEDQSLGRRIQEGDPGAASRCRRRAD